MKSTAAERLREPFTQGSWVTITPGAPFDEYGTHEPSIERPRKEVESGRRLQELLRGLLEAFSETPLRTVSLDPVLERLEELSGLEPDWDSYGGFPLSPRAVATTARLANAAVERFGQVIVGRALPYSIMPIADGGLQIEWKGTRIDVQLDIAPNGTIGYLVIDRRGTERTFEEGDEVSWDGATELIRRAVLS